MSQLVNVYTKCFKKLIINKKHIKLNIHIKNIYDIVKLKNLKILELNRANV